MGIMDNLGDMAEKHQEQIDATIAKGGDVIDSHTDGKYAEHVDRGQEFLDGKLDELTGRGEQQADAALTTDPTAPTA